MMHRRISMDLRWRWAIALSTVLGGIVPGALLFGLWLLVTPREGLS